MVVSTLEVPAAVLWRTDDSFCAGVFCAVLASHTRTRPYGALLSHCVLLLRQGPLLCRTGRACADLRSRSPHPAEPVCGGDVVLRGVPKWIGVTDASPRMSWVGDVGCSGSCSGRLRWGLRRWAGS